MKFSFFQIKKVIKAKAENKQHRRVANQARQKFKTNTASKLLSQVISKHIEEKTKVDADV